MTIRWIIHEPQDISKLTYAHQPLSSFDRITTSTRIRIAKHILCHPDKKHILWYIAQDISVAWFILNELIQRELDQPIQPVVAILHTYYKSKPYAMAMTRFQKCVQTLLKTLESKPMTTIRNTLHTMHQQAIKGWNSRIQDILEQTWKSNPRIILWPWNRPINTSCLSTTHGIVIAIRNQRQYPIYIDALQQYFAIPDTLDLFCNMYNLLEYTEWLTIIEWMQQCSILTTQTMTQTQRLYAKSIQDFIKPTE